MCGDHPLNPKVTLTECRYEKYIDGTPHLLRRGPEAAVARVCDAFQGSELTEEQDISIELLKAYTY